MKSMKTSTPESWITSTFIKVERTPHLYDTSHLLEWHFLNLEVYVGVTKPYKHQPSVKC